MLIFTTFTKLAQTYFALTNYFRIICFVLIFSQHSLCFSQKSDAPFWMDETQRLVQYPSSDFILVMDSVELDKRRKEREQRQAELRNQLLELAGRQISVRVSSQTDMRSSERVNNGTYIYEEEYRSTSAFVSDVAINTSLNDFWDRKENRYLIGILVIDRSGLAQSTNTHCEGRLKALISRLEGFLNMGQVVNTGDLRKEHREITSDRTTAIYLDPTVKSDFDQLNQRFELLMAQVESSATENNFQIELNRIRMTFERGDFAGALEELSVLSRKHPRSADILSLRGDILHHYQEEIEGKVSVYQTQNKNSTALNLLNKYLSYDAKNERLIALREQVRKDYFSQLSQELKYQLNAENISKARRKLEEMEPMSDVDPDAFLDFKQRFSELKVQEEKEEIQLAYNKHEYRQAWSLIGAVEGRYDRLEEFKSLKRKVGKKLYQEDAKALRSERPRLYSLFLDVSAKLGVDITQPSEPSKQYFFAYSAYVARKIRIESKFSTSGKDISSSDYLGISWRLRDHQSLSNLPRASEEVLVPFQQKWGHELGVKGILGRCIIVQAGIQLAQELNFAHPRAYFGELGLSIPLRHLSIFGSAIGFTRFEGEGIFEYQVGLAWRFDAVRKFSKEDRRALKYKYQ